MLCPHHCFLREGQSGRCRSRVCRNGEIVSTVYGRPCALAIDPIEKKPLLRFHPGTRILSLACTGCNLSCRFCQNHDISQVKPDAVPSAHWEPKDLVALALQEHVPGIAYTYTEPLTWYEYMRDIAREAHAAGLWNVLVSAGYVEEQPLRELIPLIDAANIDLKAFSDEVYKKVCGARLEPVLRTLKMLHEGGVHLEITNLLVPGVNCDRDMIQQMCQWLMANDMAEVPLHFSRFFPRYKMLDKAPTPLAYLYQAREIAQAAGLKYVYLGNV